MCNDVSIMVLLLAGPVMHAVIAAETIQSSFELVAGQISLQAILDSPTPGQIAAGQLAGSQRLVVVDRGGSRTIWRKDLPGLGGLSFMPISRIHAARRSGDSIAVCFSDHVRGLLFIRLDDIDGTWVTTKELSAIGDRPNAEVQQVVIDASESCTITMTDGMVLHPSFP